MNTATHDSVRRLEHESRELHTRMEEVETETRRARALLDELRRAVAAVNELGSADERLHGLVQAHAASQAECAAAVAAHAQGLEKKSAQLAADRRRLEAHLEQARSRRRIHLEQRRAERVRLETEVSLSDENNFYAGITADVSAGGLFVATIDLLPVGTEIDLSFSMPSGERIAARGEVCWTREHNDLTPTIMPGMGIQFVDLPAAAMGSIQAFVAQREPMLFEV